MLRPTILSPLLAFALGSMVWATTFVPMSDEVLVDRAEAIAEVRVLAVSPSPDSHIPSTDYLLEVERLLGGDLPGTAVVVRVLGGQRPDGTGLTIWGAPHFEPGEKALLMLEAYDDGTFRVTQFLLGAFVQVRAGERHLAVRDLRQASSFDGSSGTLEVRDWRLFRNWIEDRRSGIVREADYSLEIPVGQIHDSLQSQFTLLGDEIHLRWFEFGTGHQVPFYAHAGGQQGLNGRGFLAFQRAIEAWNLDPGSNVLYRYAGTTQARGGLFDIDGVNTILFNDLNGDIGSPFDCREGGVLAIGGPWHGASTRVFRGEAYRVVTGADIVTNSNLACFFAASPDPEATAEELFGHELGHTLGLGHSCGDYRSPICQGQLDEALMRTDLHGDGRGALLQEDDRAGLASLYPNDATCLPPAAPGSTSSYPRSATSIEAHWQESIDPVTGYRLEIAAEGSLDYTLANVASSGPDWAEIVDLDPATEYRVRVASISGRGCLSNFVESVTWTPTDDPTPPNAPSNLIAVRRSHDSSGSVSFWVTWQDRSDNDLYFGLERRSLSSEPVEPFQTIAWPRLDGTTLTPGMTVDNHLEGTTYVYRIRAYGVESSSEYSPILTVVVPPPGTPCAPSPSRSCALGDRFQIDVQWRNQHDSNAPGRPVAMSDLSDRTSTFSFFDPEALDLIVKVLDGTAISDHFWVFYGALSDLEYWISVIDTWTGATAFYHNEPGEICGRGDTQAISQAAWSLPTAHATAIAPPSNLGFPADGARCEPDSETICLQEGRFRVRVSWTDEAGGPSSGIGRAIPRTDETGMFWFFSPDITELAVKILDGRSLNGRFWFFYGALSDVAYEIEVTDTSDGTTRIYANDQGNICGLGDTTAF